MSRHELATEGAWVELKDPSELRAKDRKKILAAMFGGVQMGADGDLGVQNLSAAFGSTLAATEVCAAALITGWHIPYLAADGRLPRHDIELLGELTLGDSDAITVLVAPTVHAMLPTRITPADHEQPDSPTVPASA